MITVDLRAANGEGYRLDTPDPGLIGPWLKAIADSWNLRAGKVPSWPIEFTLRITA